jgi:integrase
MPLRLVEPRGSGKSPNYTIRGTHLGITIDRTAGTPQRKLAARVLAKLKADIEDGRLAPAGAPTFATAALSYVKAGGSKRFLSPLAEHFSTTLLTRIDQAAIDAAAAKLYPGASPATRNRQVYTPVSAILRHASVAIVIRRPRGAQGTPRTAWLDQSQAFALMAASDAVGPTFGALVRFLTYTGARLGEALALQWSDVDTARKTVTIRQTKTEGVRTAILPGYVVEAMLPLAGQGRVFYPLTKGGKLYAMLEDSARASGVSIPDRLGFHILRHTWAMMMRRHAGSDTAGLVATGAWRSRKAASVYEHLDATEEAARASRLPTRGNSSRGKDVEIILDET